MDRFPRLLGILVVIIGLGPAAPPLFSQQDISAQDFSELMHRALDEHDDALLEKTVLVHRLLVKPYVDSSLSTYALAMITGDSQEALATLDRARTTAKAFEKSHGERSLSLGVLFMEGLASGQHALKLRADSLDDLATVQRNSKAQRAEALQNYQQALATFQALNDQRGQASVLGGLGALFFLTRQMDSCRVYYEEALAARILVDDRELMGNTYNDIGYLIFWYTEKDYPRAIDYLSRSIEIRMEIGDWGNLARTYSRLANAFEDNGQTSEALDAYSNAAVLHRRTGDLDRCATAIYDCGRLERKLGNYTDALARLEEALDLRKQLGDMRKTADVYNVLGITYRYLGEYEQSYQQYEKVLAIREELKDQQGIAQTSTNIGVLLRNIGQPEQAAEYLEQSLSAFRALEDTSGMLTALSNLGLAYFDSGRIDTSERCMEQALQMARSQKNREIEIATLVNLGNTKNSKGELDEGLAIYREAHEIAQRINVPGLLWPSILGMGENYELRGNFAEAFVYYSRSLEIIEDLRTGLQSAQYKESFLATQRYVYEAVVHVLSLLHQKDPDQGYDVDAFEYAERGKARTFLDLMTEAVLGVREGIDPELLERQEELITQISLLEAELRKSELGSGNFDTMNTRMAGLEDTLRSLRNEIRRSNPRYASLNYPQPCSLSDVQADLTDTTAAVLEYLVGDSCSVLWAITKDGHIFIRLPDRQTLEEQVTVFRFALQNPNPESWAALTESAYRLYRMLVKPVESLISGSRRIRIVPDDILHLVPFEALITQPVENGTVRDFSALPYLGKKYAISYWPSSSVARTVTGEARQVHQDGPPSLLAFGDPVFAEPRPASDEPNPGTLPKDRARGTFEFPRLEHSGEEVRAISALFDDHSVRAFLRAEATEKRAKDELRNSRFMSVHFATHGAINEHRPEFSSIVLARDSNSQEDGFLRAAEVLNLSVQADLVVLSACQTGLGKMVRGEGIVGLTRAFMYAGAPSLLVSLWNVSDASTAELMKEFYGNSITKALNKDVALQHAKITMIGSTRTSHPFYWAPFVLIGDTDWH